VPGSEKRTTCDELRQGTPFPKQSLPSTVLAAFVMRAPVESIIPPERTTRASWLQVAGAKMNTASSTKALASFAVLLNHEWVLFVSRVLLLLPELFFAPSPEALPLGVFKIRGLRFAARCFWSLSIRQRSYQLSSGLSCKSEVKKRQHKRECLPQAAGLRTILFFQRFMSRTRGSLTLLKPALARCE